MPGPISVRSGSFQWKQFDIAYEHWGNQGPACILMHGLLMDSVMNRGLARRFVKAGFQVVLLDLLGHGNSSKPTDPREHRIDFYGAQALACMDHLGFDKAMMGGVSLGAITTLDAAARAPERITAMFLEMPVMEWSTTFAGILLIPVLTAAQYLRGLFRPFARTMRKLPRPRRNDLLSSVMNGMSAEPETINAILHGVLAGPVVPPADVRRSLPMPSLVIGHDWDRLHSLRDAVALARELPNAKLLKASTAGFEIRAEDSHLWPEIQRFLDSVRDEQTGGTSNMSSQASQATS